MGLFKKKQLDKKKLEGELNGLIGQLSGKPLDAVAKMFVANLKLDKERSAKYKNSEEQTDAGLERFPTMKGYYPEILAKIQKHRKECGLDV